MLVPELANPNFLTDAQTLYIVHSLCDFIPSMAYTGSTIFLHNSLYTTHQPQAYQDCVAICALYLAKTPRNKHILATSIAAKILQLAASSSTWSLTEHLAAVQSLIIYQAIRLFDPGLALQSAAQMQNPLLEVWAAHLWKRAFNENPSFASDHDCWIFYESLRRTIIMSVFTRCGWSCYSKGGLADQVPVLARLPLTKDFGAWSCDGEGWEGREGLCGGSKVVNYADFVGTWTSGCDLGDLDAFGKLLLAACVGDLDPRLLV
ncbi:hypothetical protein GQ44DRAFT_709486 [Phaeosphaeriaceae sp. PMI808]|nr:hypothetical protein GQ44DRAFT_709486 [Phaeosphaeriaceae sp. PMI808]